VPTPIISTHIIRLVSVIHVSLLGGAIPARAAGVKAGRVVDGGRSGEVAEWSEYLRG
jgi:hypothetical protein